MILGPVPRVAVLLPYWGFWEHSAGGEALSQSRRSMLRAVVERLEGNGFDVCWSGVVDSARTGAEVANSAKEAEALLVLQSMAVPPAFALASIDRLPRIPIVIWAAYHAAANGGVLDKQAITSAGATVGTPMLTNMLQRQGRPYALRAGLLHDEELQLEIAELLGVAAAATRLSRARLARIGAPLEGYGCVDLDGDALRAVTGIQVVALQPEDLVEAYRRVPPSAAAAVGEELSVQFGIASELDAGDDLERSVRMAAALEDLSDVHAVDGGAVNCHVTALRLGRDPGIAPCLALGRETSRGRPWTCTGDVVTAVAMLAVKALGRPALYHEIEYLDNNTNEALLANSGEHDIGWLEVGTRPYLRRNAWYVNASTAGACAVYPMATGPASLVSFTPHSDEPSGFRFITAQGQITERVLGDSPTVGGAFRFNGREGVVRAWQHWAEAGAIHHSVATPGHVAAAVALVAKFLGVGAVQTA